MQDVDVALSADVSYRHLISAPRRQRRCETNPSGSPVSCPVHSAARLFHSPSPPAASVHASTGPILRSAARQGRPPQGLRPAPARAPTAAPAGALPSDARAPSAADSDSAGGGRAAPAVLGTTPRPGSDQRMAATWQAQGRLRGRLLTSSQRGSSAVRSEGQ
jgi:hypothetical protein